MSAGSSGGAGYFSSRYSRIASDWNSVVPLSSTSAGSAICGLILRYSGSRCALASRSTKITSAGTFFRLSAMRTRKLASDRQKEKNFMGGSRHSSCAGLTRASIHLREMDHRVKPGDDKIVAVAAVLLLFSHPNSGLPELGISNFEVG